MFPVVKWATPVVALALLMSFNTAARAEDAKASSSATGSVSGTVLDGEGKAVSGALVRLFKPFDRGQGRPASAAKAEKRAEAGKPEKGEKPDKADRPKPVATATTDSSGKFTLSDVPAGEYMIIAMVRGQGNDRQPIKVKAGETANVELKLHRKDGGSAKTGEKPAKKAEKHGDE